MGGGHLIILGAGGHGRVVLDAARASGWQVDGFLDPGPAAGQMINGCPVLGDDRELGAQLSAGNVEFIVAIGHQQRRRKLAGDLERRGGRLAIVAHPAAIVSPFAILAPGTLVAAGAIVNANAEIGRYGIVNTGAIVEHDCRLAEGVQVGPGAHLAAAVRLGIGVFVGAGATLIPGVTVGAESVIGAGAVVIRDLPPSVTAVGVPARILPIG